jgi:hypothetical protein
VTAPAEKLRGRHWRRPFRTCESKASVVPLEPALSTTAFDALPAEDASAPELGACGVSTAHVKTPKRVVFVDTFRAIQRKTAQTRT